jgi:hypothetical protein
MRLRRERITVRRMMVVVAIMAVASLLWAETIKRRAS